MTIHQAALKAYSTQSKLDLDKIKSSILVEHQEGDLYAFKIISPVTGFREIFIYSEEFEAIHIRGGDVARGGIRISTRSDYHKEALDLVLAQIPKNSIIVPTGSKGCIFIKGSISPADAYKHFARTLIKLTQKTDDDYLVIAADKGTAKYSDLANDIAHEEGFWLDDAFASGGSNGYDHKELGITSLGTWQSILVRLESLNIDIDIDPVSMIGIGSMNGDVFGNGVLYSSNIKLLAAVSSREIFIDPNPDLDIAYHERKRIFNLDDSSWNHYDRSKLSQGGMIINRSEKSVELTPEVSQMLNISNRDITPDQLISLLLKYRVDILFMGAVGTYVQASNESIDFDAANANIRVNAKDLKCKVFAEGANLSITHAGRVEAVRSGVLVYTDFIDNVAGVFCSDIEVNLKILLKDFDLRDAVISDLENHYVNYILEKCYIQASALQNASLLTGWYKLYEAISRHIKIHQFEFSGDCAPDIAYLMSYAKIYLAEKLLKSDLSSYGAYLNEYFAFMVARDLNNFKYKDKLIATLLASDIVNYLFEYAANVEDIVNKIFEDYRYEIKFKGKNVLIINFLK